MLTQVTWHVPKVFCLRKFPELKIVKRISMSCYFTLKEWPWVVVGSCSEQELRRLFFFTSPPHHLHTDLLQCIVGVQECTVILDTDNVVHCERDALSNTGIALLKWRDRLICLHVAVGLWPWVVFTKWRFYWKRFVIVLSCEKDAARTLFCPDHLPGKLWLFLTHTHTQNVCFQSWVVQWGPVTSGKWTLSRENLTK